METGGGRFGVSETLGALNAALKKELGPPASVWFKESSARNLRSRDFLAPQAALRALFAGGPVPKGIIEDVISLKCPGVPPLQSCQQTPLGLTVQLQRPAAFQQVLNSIAEFTKPSQAASGKSIILNCTPLRSRRSLDMLSLSNLRAILVTDHLAEVLRIQGMNVHLVPAVPDEGIQKFLHQLSVDWPSELEAAFIPEDVLALKQVLSQCPYATVPGLEPRQMRLADDVIFKVHLKNFLVQQSLEGYDPNLDVCLVTEEKLRVLAELRQIALRCAGTGPAGCCRVVHVVSCKGEFQQQQVDLLWRMLDLGPHTALQKHLVCGPVKVANSPSPVGAPQYFQLRRCQMYEASVMKYGDLVQDDSWTEIISVLTSAAIRFEMLSTAHYSQIILDLEDSSISTKGTKSGAFVMYNCARLATLFKTYQQAVEQGAYPAFPPASELNFSLLREEGEWLLLFNYILPFPETLSQSAQLPFSSKGIRITASTEAVCKFLIHLSMDFSSYYNRVHILGEPLPHLFSQMFARLQLMKGVREVIHRALATLHLPPLSQI
ncbi:LOW QUALITY PROTEIN: DALR anticodon-binding domain-containing protein 3 [Dermochelys coriacea]|uniref:LOW QUALITY PROTEIN: DALR anticodon-binding domain-containing protein 3 n=1 Tax=Dermochelys coriacea TaxID=27794 RepID=UPI0018E8E707|nr:LOW QUALITY PROTEIN: DALR anticodon-binding domain-containing protein 3 [Dermochelys coriacea]